MNIAEILNANYPGTQWGLTGTEYSGLEWLDESPKPTKAALEKQWAEVQHKLAYEEVTRQRIVAYQLESDPIFMEAQREEGRTLDEWKAKVEEIKARYPYPVLPK